MSTKNISWGYGRPVRRAELTNFMCLEPSGPVLACTGIALLRTLFNMNGVHAR